MGIDIGPFDEPRTEGWPITIAAGATSGFRAIGPVPAGYWWIIDGVSTYSTSVAAAPILECHVTNDGSNAPFDRTTRVDWTNTPTNAISDEFNPIMLREGLFYLVYITAAAAGNRFDIAIRYRIRPMSPWRVTPIEVATLTASAVLDAMQRSAAVEAPN